MTLFLEIVLSFPTVLFTIALCIASLYWMMVVLGALDIEMLDVGDGLIDGALDGLDGAVDGALEAVDGALDAAEGAVDGAVDAAGDAVDGAADGLEGAPAGFGPLLFLASVFRLGKVPLTVSLTAFSLWGWVVGFLLTWLYTGTPASIVPHALFAGAAMVGSVVISATLTNVSVRPLEPAFKLHGARERKSLVGEVCEVTTGRVDDRFGQATAQVGSDDLLFQVRCDKPNAMRRGDAALIVSFDTERNAYVIEPMAVIDTQAERAPVANPLQSPALVNKEV